MLQRLYLSDPEYFALPHASNSGIKEAHKLFSASDTGDWVPTKAFEFGSALDALLTNPGITDTSMLSEDDRQRLGPMRRNLHMDPTFLALKFEESDRQVIFVEDEFPIDLDGLPVLINAKCKYDFWLPKHHFGADLKALDCKTQQEFESAFKFFKYPMQGAWYMDTSKSDRFIFFAVSKRNFKVFIKAMKRGDENYKAGRDMYHHYAKSWCKLHGFVRA